MDGLHITSNELESGTALFENVRTLSFTAPSHNGIAISYQAGEPRCLWVIMPVDINYPYWSERGSILPAISNPERILPEPSDANYPDPTIFGLEPPHDWCYYFQKASLARQFGEWETIRTLGDEARSLGYGPNNLYERMPFIDGYIHVRDWKMAELLTKEVFLDEPKFQQALCAVWARATNNMTLSPDEKETVNSIISATGCNAP